MSSTSAGPRSGRRSKISCVEGMVEISARSGHLRGFAQDRSGTHRAHRLRGGHAGPGADSHRPGAESRGCVGCIPSSRRSLLSLRGRGWCESGVSDWPTASALVRPDLVAGGSAGMSPTISTSRSSALETIRHAARRGRVPAGSGRGRNRVAEASGSEPGAPSS